MGGMYRTKRGGDPFQLTSAIQKCIRRGDERLACIFALELAETSPSAHGMLMNRMLITATEDIGPADFDAVQFAAIGLRECREYYAQKKSPHTLMLFNVIIRLCRANKSRDGVHMCSIADYTLKTHGIPPIPDVALDMHTSAGKKMGRGMGFFIEHGSVLIPETETKYKEEAQNIWRLSKWKNQDFDIPAEDKVRALEWLDAYYEQLGMPPRKTDGNYNDSSKPDSADRPDDESNGQVQKELL